LYFHFARVGFEELDALPSGWFHFMHICDTDEDSPISRDQMRHVARDERLYFGEGHINFREILSHLPDMPYAIELPNIARVTELGYEEHARRCLETARLSIEDPGTGLSTTLA
jgi:sugar phosphate isomerase/epimerase